MFYFMISFIILLGFLFGVERKYRAEKARLQARFGIFALRDELRATAIRGEIEQDNWFDYFDTTFTKMLDVLPQLTMWQIALLLVHYWKDPVIEKSAAELGEFLNEPENAFYKSLFDRYASCVSTFILRRHRVWNLFFVSSAHVTMTLLEKKAEASKVVATVPETSTFLKHCHS